MATPNSSSTSGAPKAPLSVLFVTGLSLLQAAYLAFRGIYDPLFGNLVLSPQQRVVSGVIQMLLAAAITYFALKFYSGSRKARTPIVLIYACIGFIGASNIYTYVRYLTIFGAEAVPVSFMIVPAITLVLSLVSLIFIFIPTTTTYLQQVQEANDNDLKRHSATGRQ